MTNSLDFNSITRERPKTLDILHRPDEDLPFIRMCLELSELRDPAHDVPLYNIMWIRGYNIKPPYTVTFPNGELNEKEIRDPVPYVLAEIQSETGVPLRMWHDFTPEAGEYETAYKLRGVTKDVATQLINATNNWSVLLQARRNLGMAGSEFQRAATGERLTRQKFPLVLRPVNAREATNGVTRPDGGPPATP